MRTEDFQINNFKTDTTILVTLIILLLLGLAMVAFCYYSARYLIILPIEKIFYGGEKKKKSLLFKYHIIQRIAYLVPAIFLYAHYYLFDIRAEYFTLLLADAVRPFSLIYIIYDLALIISSILNYILAKYENLDISKLKPIKSYLQIIKIILFIIATVFTCSILFEESPTYFFTSIGALAAIIALIFRDSILGFIASLQLVAYDMVHIGDSIEMPNYGADGEVIDISLNTIKIQNADKSIVTIPSYALLSSGVKNWRGMHEAGGRRVKRSIYLDITSIKICNTHLIEQLNKLSIFKETLQQKLLEFERYNQEHHIDPKSHADGKQLSNISAFRYYLEAYLAQHPDVHKAMRISVRQLQATATGLPIELYFFTNDIDADHYESIQAEILDYIYSILPVFELHAFQYASAYSDGSKN